MRYDFGPLLLMVSWFVFAAAMACKMLSLIDSEWFEYLGLVSLFFAFQASVRSER